VKILREWAFDMVAGTSRSKKNTSIEISSGDELYVHKLVRSVTSRRKINRLTRKQTYTVVHIKIKE